MRIPKSVDVLGETYKVIFIKGLSEKQGLDGYADPENYVIALDARLKKIPRVLKRVYLHEVAHCFAFESGLAESLSRDACEMFCQNLSGMICQLTR